MSSERMGIVAQKSNEKSTDCLKETSYFNTEKLVNTSAAFIARSRSSLQHKTESTYDRMFHVKEGYNSKLHRDDREHTQNLDVHSEVQYTSVDILQNHIFLNLSLGEAKICSDSFIVRLRTQKCLGKCASFARSRCSGAEGLLSRWGH